jgi:hypothetical protein
MHPFDADETDAGNAAEAEAETTSGRTDGAAMTRRLKAVSY